MHKIGVVLKIFDHNNTTLVTYVDTCVMQWAIREDPVFQLSVF